MQLLESIQEKIKFFFQNYKYPLYTGSFLVILTFIIVTIHFLKDSTLSFLQDYSNVLTLTIGAVAFFGIVILLNQVTHQGEPSLQRNIVEQLKFYTKYVGFLSIGVIILVSLLYALTYGSIMSLLSLFAILIAAIVVGLYIIQHFIRKLPIFSFIQDSKILNVIYHGIFIIPCYIVETATKLFTNVKSTKPSIYYLLLAEIILISLYFLLPYVYKKIYTHDMKVLQDKPIYLNSQHTLGKYEELYHETKKEPYNYRYGISMKLFIDQNLPNDSVASVKDTPVFSYGKKPLVTFNVKEDTFKVICRKGIDGEEIIYQTKELPRQKWNHIVINYDGGTMDVFVNEVLVTTKKNVVPYMTHDNILSGSDSGIYGGIKEVYYSNTPFTLTKMKLL